MLIVDHFGIELSELADLDGEKKRKDYKIALVKYSVIMGSILDFCILGGHSIFQWF